MDVRDRMRKIAGGRSDGEVMGITAGTRAMMDHGLADGVAT